MHALTCTGLLAALAAPCVSSDAQGVPARTLARNDTEFPVPFSEVVGIRELSDGRVIVLDRREAIVRVVDFSAGTVCAIGRTGQGPGEYRTPRRLLALPGDSTLIEDATGRMVMVRPDATPGDMYDPNRPLGDSLQSRVRRLFVRFSDRAGRLYGEAQPIRVTPDGELELAESASIERLDRSRGRRDTVALWPLRKDANPRVIDGMVLTQPRTQAFAAWDHWVVASDGRIAMVFQDPYRVDHVGTDARIVRGRPIAYERVKVDPALKQQHMGERQRAMGGLPSSGQAAGQQRLQAMQSQAEWPEYLPPFLGTSMFGTDGRLWIPRAVAAGAPLTYDIVDGTGRLVQRITLPPRARLVGFGEGTAYLVRLDADDLQYLQRYRLSP